MVVPCPNSILSMLKSVLKSPANGAVRRPPAMSMFNPCVSSLGSPKWLPWWPTAVDIPLSSYPPGPPKRRKFPWRPWPRFTPPCLEADELVAASIPRVALSTLIVFARGRIVLPAAPPAFTVEFFRTLPAAVAVVLLVLSRLPFLGREEGVVVIWSFCWWRNRRSRLAKHLVHSGHSNGFSFVWDLSCLLRCSSLANERPQVPHT